MSAGGDGWLVCLDLGGVVVKHCRTWEEGCASAGLDVREPHRMNTPELAARRKDLNHAHQKGELAPEAFWRSIAEATDGLYTPEEIERLHHAWLLEAYEGVPELVGELATVERVTLACLSNTNVPHWEMSTLYNGGALNGLPIMEHLAHKMVSHELGAAKPEARIYELAEQITGFAGERIVFFDDLEENIAACHSRGWRGVLIDHEGCPATQMRSALEGIGILNSTRSSDCHV